MQFTTTMGFGIGAIFCRDDHFRQGQMDEPLFWHVNKFVLNMLVSIK